MSSKVILALGADIKNRFIIAENGRVHPGPDIGDLSLSENYDTFRREVSKAVKRFKPDIIACDLHPGYFSTRLARSLRPTTYGLRPIQHHHAHIASVLYEYGIKRPVIGVSFDGTGYGTDGNIWGGEFLLVKGAKFERLAHLQYRMMPGGERAVHEPWRMVLSILGDGGLDLIKGVSKKKKEIVLSMLDKNINAPLTSSAGRLFDAAAALLGVCTTASYEAEGPIKLEAMCEDKVPGTYASEAPEASAINTDGIFKGMVRDMKKGKDKGFIAAKFHNSMGDIAVNTVKRLSKRLGIRNVALSGGVFQNKFLTARVIKALTAERFNVYINNKTAVSDLNIALGQYHVSCSAGKN